LLSRSGIRKNSDVLGRLGGILANSATWRCKKTRFGLKNRTAPADPFLLEPAWDGSLGNSMSLQRLQGINRRAKPAPGRMSAPAALALCCALLGSGTGCKTGIGPKKNEDPLFGLKPPTVAPIPPSDQAHANTDSPQASWNNIPPIPTMTSAGSTAALASLPGAKAPLRINDAQPARNTGPTVQPIPRDVPANPGLLTTTGGWQTPPATYAAGGATSPPLNPGNPAANQTPEQALAELKTRGVLSHKIDAVPEGIRLTALVPDRTRPGQFLTREVRAPSVQAAVQTLLKELAQ
jgi:hypothetical protein